jgi:hypothetical protein
LVDLLSQNEDNAEVKSAHISMLNDCHIQTPIRDVAQWDKSVLKRHNDVAHPIYKLSFLEELGIKKNDEGMPRIIEYILNHFSAEGPFQVLTNFASGFGGSGMEEMGYCSEKRTIQLANFPKISN